MTDFKVVPISKQFANEIRRKGKDESDNSVIEEVATGIGPCRVSLRTFRVGIDERLLFSYSPFSIDNPFNQYGPVFIHKKDVKEYSDIYTFPPAIKSDPENFPLTLIGYDKNQLMNYSKRVGDEDVDKLISNIFSNHDEVKYLHARNSEACCFICKIERV